MWQVINKELGKSIVKKQDITINIGPTEIVNPKVHYFPDIPCTP
jgi:hypothetical protein